MPAWQNIPKLIRQSVIDIGTYNSPDTGNQLQQLGEINVVANIPVENSASRNRLDCPEGYSYSLPIVRSNGRPFAGVPDWKMSIEKYEGGKFFP